MRLVSLLCLFLFHLQIASSQPASMAIDSPKTTVKDFLELSWEGKYEEASKYLISSGAETPPEELARRLSIIMEKHLAIDPEFLSSESNGDTTDGMYSAERLGELPDKDGVLRPLTLQKRSNKSGWAFSRASVALIDEWYERLENSWLQKQLPSSLLRAGPLGLLWWQWVASILFVMLGIALGRVLGWLTRQILAGVMRPWSGVWNDNSHRRMKRVTNIFWCAALLSIFLLFLELSPPRVATIQRILSALMIASFFWGGSRLVQALGASDHVKRWTHENPSMSALLPLMLSSARIIILVLTVIVLLSGFGYPVASIIAGLGIGGLAIALAAQKTGEDLFGSLVIGLDRPFLVGDSVKIEGDLTGEIESIGLRSTRIRTLDRTLVTIPNGKLAAMKIESFTARDRMRLSCVLALTYQTSPEQIKQITQDIEVCLRAHPKIWPDLIIARFQEYATYSLNIEVMAWMQTRDWVELKQIREEILLQFASIVEKAGSHFATVTPTIVPNEPS
jgi:MscS family membrane protein